MIKLTFADLNKGGFTQVLAKLSNKDGFASLSAALKISKMLKQVEENVTIAREQHIKMLNKYAKKDENGAFITPENHQPGDAPYIISPEHEETYNTAMDEFMMTEITVEGEPLKASELGSVMLSPNDLNDLGEAFDMDEATV